MEIVTGSVVMTNAAGRGVILTDDSDENYPTLLIADLNKDGIYVVQNYDSLFTIHAGDFDPEYFLDMWALGKR